MENTPKKIKLLEDTHLIQTRLEISHLILNEEIEEGLLLTKKINPNIEEDFEVYLNNLNNNGINCFSKVNFELCCLKYLKLIVEKNFKLAFEFGRNKLATIYKSLEIKIVEKNESIFSEMKKEIEVI